jgi:hypothetical protein
LLTVSVTDRRSSTEPGKSEVLRLDPRSWPRHPPPVLCGVLAVLVLVLVLVVDDAAVPYAAVTRAAASVKRFREVSARSLLRSIRTERRFYERDAFNLLWRAAS